MKKMKLIVLFVAAGFAHSAIADGQWVVGAGAGIISTPYKQYQRDIIPVPVVSYEGDRLWLGGLGGGYYLWNDDSNKLSFTAYYDPNHFKPGDSDSHLLKKLDKRHSSVMAGISYEHNTSYGILRTSLAGDTIRKSNGFVGDMAWLYRYNISRFSVQPGLGVHYFSKKYNDYYYGVTGKESSRSGLKAYSASDSWNPYVELTASYNFAGNWSIFGSGSYEKTGKTVENSPMVDKSWSGMLSTGVTYQF